jgi:hypothetical protein
VADDIETVCKRMVDDANSQLEKYEKEQVKKGVKKPDSMRTFISQYGPSKSRTGEEQAKEVLEGDSWTCNSSHMADAARHVGPVLNGKKLTSMGALKKAVSKEDYECFVEIYGAAMKKQGLKNFKGGADFLPASKDPLHMELADSRLPSNHPEIEKCRQAYAKATRQEGHKRNEDFEKADKKWLEAYDKANPQPAAEGGKG